VRPVRAGERREKMEEKKILSWEAVIFRVAAVLPLFLKIARGGYGNKEIRSLNLHMILPERKELV
jgi:hypothetical protein